MKTSFPKRSLRTGWLALAAIALAPASMAAIIYQDDFNRSGALAQSTPTVTTNNAKWTGGGTTSTTGGGQLSPDGKNSLPFSPTAGNIYTLSYTLNPTAAGPDVNIDIGFMNSSTPYVATFFQEIRFGTNNNNSISTFARKNNVSIDIDDPAPNSPTNYQIVLNTTGSTWTAEFLWGNTSLTSQTSQDLGTPNITEISFHVWAGGPNTDAVVTNFSLTSSTAVPEPGTFIPAAVLVAGALLRRRRSRSHRSGRATA